MKLILNGEPCEATKCEVTTTPAEANEISRYWLADGTLVTVRCIVTGVYKFKDKVDQHGNPIYHVNWYVVPSTEQP